jgi:hypothetical protein
VNAGAEQPVKEATVNDDSTTPQYQPSAEEIAMKELRMNARHNHAASLIYIRKLEEQTRRLRDENEALIGRLNTLNHEKVALMRRLDGAE